MLSRPILIALANLICRSESREEHLLLSVHREMGKI